MRRRARGRTRGPVRARPADVPDDWEVFAEPGAGFTLWHPAGWEASRGTERDWSFSGPPGGPLESVSVAVSTYDTAAAGGPYDDKVQMAETFLENPTLFVLIPVMVDTGGNIGTILSARLSTRLHLGDIEFRLRDPVIVANVTAVLLLSVTMFTILALAAYAIGAFLGGSLELSVLFVVSVGSGLGITVVSVVISIAATYRAVAWGIDPDDVVVPLVTSICDVLGVVIFTAVVIIVV